MAGQAIALALPPAPAHLCPLCHLTDDHDIACPAGWGGPREVDVEFPTPRPADHPSVLRRFGKYIAVRYDKLYRDPRTGRETPCHEWTGGRSRGANRFSDKAWYGTFNPGGEVKGGVRAHVFIAWIAKLIPGLRVPAGMNIDHCCGFSLCVNPEHFEVVPSLENQKRKHNRG